MAKFITEYVSGGAVGAENSQCDVSISFCFLGPHGLSSSVRAFPGLLESAGQMS